MAHKTNHFSKHLIPVLLEMLLIWQGLKMSLSENLVAIIYEITQENRSAYSNAAPLIAFFY